MVTGGRRCVLHLKLLPVLWNADAICSVRAFFPLAYLHTAGPGWQYSAKPPSCVAHSTDPTTCLKGHSDGFFSRHTNWSATPPAIRGKITRKVCPETCLTGSLCDALSVSWGASSQTRGFSCGHSWNFIVLLFLCSRVPEIQRPASRCKVSFTTLRGNLDIDCFLCIHQYPYCCFVVWFFICILFCLGFCDFVLEKGWGFIWLGRLLA